MMGRTVARQGRPCRLGRGAHRAAAAMVTGLVLTGLLIGCARGGGTAPSAAGGGGLQVFAVADRQPAPRLTGELLDGGDYDLTARAGDVIVINFWAQWCGPCVAEADDLEATYQATKASGVTFLGINTRDERDKARNFLLGRATYPSLFDPAGKLALGFAVAPNAIPATIIVDRSGRIAAIARTAVLRENLEPVVRALATEST